MAYREAAAARVRRLLAGRADITEKKMMGGLVFMAGDHMCCGVSGDALLIRVGRDAYAATLAEPHVRPMAFGGRRPTGFVLVDPDGFADDAALAAWVRRGLDFVATLPAKPRAKSLPRSRRAIA